MGAGGCASGTDPALVADESSAAAATSSAIVAARPPPPTRVSSSTPSLFFKSELEPIATSGAESTSISLIWDESGTEPADVADDSSAA